MRAERLETLTYIAATTSMLCFVVGSAFVHFWGLAWFGWAVWGQGLGLWVVALVLRLKTRRSEK